MRLWILSDLHAERDGTDLDAVLGNPPVADVCVVAGDFDVGPRALRYLGERVCPSMPVIYTPGNHCYWRRHYERTRSEMAAIRVGLPGLHLLDPGSVVIDGVRFIGTTLWTDFEIAGSSRVDESLELARPKFRSISTGPSDGERLWTPEDARRQHGLERAWLNRALALPHEGPTVIVSHHAPHPDSIHPRYRLNGMAHNAAYTSDLTDLIERYRPDLWVHGHVHDTVDYRVGDTRIVANPRGYSVRSVSEGGLETVRYHGGDAVTRPAGHDRAEVYEGPENRAFQAGLVIELDAKAVEQAA